MSVERKEEGGRRKEERLAAVDSSPQDHVASEVSLTQLLPLLVAVELLMVYASTLLIFIENYTYFSDRQ